MANSWMKLYHETLNDPKMGTMSDHLYRRTIELFLLAGQEDRNGLLPSLPQIAWALRTTTKDVTSVLHELTEIGIISETPEGYNVTHFVERQNSNLSGAERVAKLRVYAKGNGIAIDNAKKGVKVTVGNYTYKITSVSKKKSTVALVTVKANLKNKIKKVSVPKTVKIKSLKGKNKGTYSYKVTSISDNAFKKCSKLTNVTIGANVTTIGKNAFAGCAKLKKVTLSKSVVTIKSAAFSGDKKLLEVVIPKDCQLTTIEKNAFKGCVSLKKINIPVSHFEIALSVTKILSASSD